ncbi:MAG: nuclear transport factor 2 family protein [Acidobacteria bacterium]|nr:nuclear transport factor 2 family protein [Acidobacteriota bacterium]
MSTRSAQEVLDHHVEALMAGDLDAILSDYADDAVMISPMGVAKGHEALGGMFGAIPTEFWEGFEITQQNCEGEIAYMVWKTDSISSGSDTLIVRDGLVVGQTVVMA